MDRRALSPLQMRQARIRMRMSQREAAAAIGVQESTISRWENGASVPQTGTFERMLEAYGLVPKFEDLGAEVEALRRRVDDLEAAARVNARGEAAAGRVEQGGAPPTDDADSPPEGAAPESDPGDRSTD